MTRLAVVGGNAAGMSAAAVARRRDPELDVLVLERGPYTSYSGAASPTCSPTSSTAPTA